MSISIAEFKDLSDEIQREVISEEAVLELIKDTAKPTSAVADALGAKYATVYSRLGRMFKKGLVKKKYKNKEAYWIDAKALTAAE